MYVHFFVIQPYVILHISKWTPRGWRQLASRLGCQGYEGQQSSQGDTTRRQEHKGQ